MLWHVVVYADNKVRESWNVDPYQYNAVPDGCRVILHEMEGWPPYGGDLYDPETGTFRKPPPNWPKLAGERRAERESAGVRFQPEGAKDVALFPTGEDARAKLTGAALAATLDPALRAPWKTAEGGFVILGAADIKALFLHTTRYVAACYARESALAAEAASGKTPDLDAGWPGQDAPEPTPPAKDAA